MTEISKKKFLTKISKKNFFLKEIFYIAFCTEFYSKNNGENHIKIGTYFQKLLAKILTKMTRY